MKTGDIQDRGDGELHVEVDSWTPWQYYVSQEELEPYYRLVNGLIMKLERMPPAVRARLKRIEIRCPVKGCLLATVYWIPSRPTAQDLEDYRRDNAWRTAHGRPPAREVPQPGRYLYVGRTAGGTEVYDVVNYLFGDLCPGSIILYWRAGCRHGTATISHAEAEEMFSLAERAHHMLETEEQAVARLPEHLRPFWGKRVFHPEPAAWHPKKRRPIPVTSALVKQIRRTRAA